MLEEAVRDALAVKPPNGEDAAIGELALLYARQIDEGGVAEKLGPALLAALEALQMSPRARATVQKGAGDVRPGDGALDQLAQRRARKSDPPALDATAP